MYQLPVSLTKRLRQLGIDEEEKERLIIKYSEEAKEYIALMLPNFNLSDKQVNILSEAYIQYQLFSYVELESLVEDKKNFLETVIEKIRENKENDSNLNIKENKNKKRIRVF